MATYTPKRLGQAVLTNTAAALYTAPASTSTIVKTIAVANTTTSSATATVYLIPTPGTAGSASDSNTVIPGVSIPANTTKVFTINQVMNASDVLAAKASVGTTLTVTVSGVEIV